MKTVHLFYYGADGFTPMAKFWRRVLPRGNLVAIRPAPARAAGNSNAAVAQLELEACYLLPT